MSESESDERKRTVQISEAARNRLFRLGINPKKVAQKSGIFKISALEEVPKAWLLTPEGKKIPMKSKFSVGREPVNDYVIDKVFVSRKHLLIVNENEDEFWLMDLGSMNGTFINGKPVEKPERLASGDLILIGDQMLIFYLGEVSR